MKGKVTPAAVHLYLPNDQNAALPYFLSSSCIGDAAQRRWARMERKKHFSRLDTFHTELVDEIVKKQLKLEFGNCGEVLSSLMYVFFRLLCLYSDAYIYIFKLLH